MNNFITKEIERDILNNEKNIVVRFPPEPNGYLHLGHAKSIIINSKVAKKFNGKLNLRFDDTNPEKETNEYVNAIKEDAFWLVDNFNNIFWTSNYFNDIYKCALLLIEKGLAYVDEHSVEEIKEMRGNFHKKGIESIYRNRSIEENIKIFKEMKDGKFKDGEKVLRAKIDMSHENMNMRDPVIYRIKKIEHHNTGNKWCIYPMYDFAHPISDGLEGITHSLCTLEFENHKILYNWFVENCKEYLKSLPKEIEFSELDIKGIVLSKRKLNKLVEEKKVNGWNDPIMPTISGLRNRGITSEMIHEFIERAGVSKVNTNIDKEILNETIRDILNPKVERTMAIINPVLLEITNFDNHFTENETIKIPLNPKNKEEGFRNIKISKNVYVEKTDIKIEKDSNFWRIYKGNTIRLKHGYNLLIKDIVVDENKNPIKVLSEIDFESKNMKKAKVKAKAAIHWLSEEYAEKIDLTNYSNLINEEGHYNEKAKENKKIFVHKDIISRNDYFEFERVGYYYLNNKKVNLLTYIKNYK